MAENEVLPQDFPIPPSYHILVFRGCPTALPKRSCPVNYPGEKTYNQPAGDEHHNWISFGHQTCLFFSWELTAYNSLGFNVIWHKISTIIIISKFLQYRETLLFQLTELYVKHLLVTYCTSNFSSDGYFFVRFFSTLLNSLWILGTDEASILSDPQSFPEQARCPVKNIKTTNYMYFKSFY